MVNRDTWVVSLVFCLLWVAPSMGADLDQYFRGQVLSVEEHVEVRTDGFREQIALVEITTGPFQGESVEVINLHNDDFYPSFFLQAGMELILVASAPDGVLTEVHVQDIARDRPIAYLVGLFAIALLLVGMVQGVKTIISLALTGFVILRILLPLFLAGYSPIPTATISAASIVAIILLIIGGVSRKSVAAILGTTAGLFAAGLLALWIGDAASLTGFGSQEAQMLVFMDQAIDIRGLLFAGIIIGSLGAVTDVGMSVASAAYEIQQANPEMTPWQLILRAMNVGRDIMGTMGNTLLLAYVGGATPLLLVLLGYEMPWLRIVNMDLIATEIVRGVAGSIGLVVSIPVTAVAAGFLLTKTKKTA